MNWMNECSQHAKFFQTQQLLRLLLLTEAALMMRNSTESLSPTVKFGRYRLSQVIKDELCRI